MQFGRRVGRIHLEGTMSQIFHSWISNYFMKSRILSSKK